jgi:hypothetical protein
VTLHHPRLVTIQRLYHELQALPSELKPSGKTRPKAATARYLELVRLIRIESDAFKRECPEAASSEVLISPVREQEP